MGPGSTATSKEMAHAYTIGILIAKQGWHILTGGSNLGVMDAALKGAKEADPDCTTIGILSHRGDKNLMSDYIDIAIPTGMGEGRNYLNVLTSDIIVCCCNNPWSSMGTMSEINFAFKHRKPFIGLHYPDEDTRSRDLYRDIFKNLSEEYQYDKQKITDSPADAIETIAHWLTWK